MKSILLAIAVILTTTATADAKVYLSQDDALALAFRGCDVERKTHYLTDAQVKTAAKLSGEKVRSALLQSYAATCDGKPGGTAYFDVHRVRTLAETLMIVVSPKGQVTRIEVLEFNEPEEYRGRPGWYRQFIGKGLSAGLQLKKDITGIAGATLTARATTSAVRRVLALHEVVNEAGK